MHELRTLARTSFMMLNTHLFKRIHTNRQGCLVMFLTTLWKSSIQNGKTWDLKPIEHPETTAEKTNPSGFGNANVPVATTKRHGASRQGFQEIVSSKRWKTNHTIMFVKRGQRPSAWRVPRREPLANCRPWSR